MLKFPLFEGDAGNGGSGGDGGATANPPASSPAPAPAPAPSPAGIADGFTGIPQQFASDPDFQSFKSLDDVLTDYKQLKGLHANREANGMLEMIGENSTPEQVQAFYEKLGKPKSAAEYELSRPEDLPQGMDYSDELAAKFAEFAHGQHLSKAQVQAVFGFYHDSIKEAWSQHETMQEQAIADNFKALETKWGAEGSESFQKNHQNALRAFNYVADRELADAFKADPQLASNPLVLDLLGRLGSKMSSDTVPSVNGTLPSGNFQESVPAIDKAIQEFHSNGNFKKMMGTHGEEAKALKAQWDQLWSKKRELESAAQ